MTRPAALILAALIIAASAPRVAPIPDHGGSDWTQLGAPQLDPLRDLTVPVQPASGGTGGAPSLPAAPTTEPIPTPAPSDTISLSAPSGMAALKGQASWFCLPGRSACTRGYQASGLYAAAGPALRAWLGQKWRGSEVYVSTEDRSIRVRLVDTMANRDRLLDLFASSFAFLAPLSRGVIEVSVTPV